MDFLILDLLKILNTFFKAHSKTKTLKKEKRPFT